MPRDKDTALAAGCRLLGEAARESLKWFADNEALVGYRKATVDRAAKLASLEARKLALAAERPMSVGVFGASQAGKSFLVGRFIAPDHQSAAVILGDEKDPVRMDFLREINPVGGDETTGLVTRFSVRRQPSPFKAYPVPLRLLSEGDLVKILANSFVLDLSGLAERAFDSDRLTALVAEAESQRQATPFPGFDVEAVLDLEQYLQKELDAHPLNVHEPLREAYWIELERLVPFVPPAARAALLAPLWGEVPEFSALYLELRAALDELGHADLAYISLDAVRDRQQGVLHVKTIYHLDPVAADGAFDPKGQEAITIMTAQGRQATLRKAVVTALTAELCITLESAPWPFFEHTDFLDFPGARGRLSSTAVKILRESRKENKFQERAYCYLRGKVAVLFDKYSSDLELNTMLLCADDRNQEVAKLADLVQGWVARTHGATPEKREGSRTTLFFCLTKADTLFQQKAGATSENIITTRFNKDVGFYASWTKEWKNGKPFSNIFMIRNPKFVCRDLFEYEAPPAGSAEDDVGVERGLLPGVTSRLEAFRKTFLGLDVVQTHVADPEAKLDAVLRLNDGGVTLLADHLAPTCDPDLKFTQVHRRAQDLAQTLKSVLSGFHEGGDLEHRLRERQRDALKVLQCFQTRADCIGRFIALLEIDEETLGQEFLKVARGEEDETSGEADRVGTTMAPLALGAGGLSLSLSLSLDKALPDLLGGAMPVPKPSLAAVFGEAAVRRWLTRLGDAAQDEVLAERHGLTVEAFSIVVRELEIAARRYKLAGQIAEELGPILSYHQRPDEHMARVAMVSAMIINGLVCHLGRDRPDARNGDRRFFAKSPPVLKDGLPCLPEDLRELDGVRTATLSDWALGFVFLAQESASSLEGGVIDVEQNARMGAILKQIAQVAGEEGTHDAH
ncbi:virulence factor SrfC family protein [Pararhodospirillum oryzae]|uniref:Virulence factor n=1 Tax=Pararhodospirillum oryzae TaxID=478448 RepID=A0A512H8J1_9PROT|nr:virulence factor SrfC family protein [Pararhodospirillum oryzae]GEO81720.1 virulence factor [Pararhodospirillum oryzae]